MMHVIMIAMDTVRELVVVLGGASRVSRRLGLRTPSGVTNWYETNTIPPRHWFDLEAMAKDAGRPDITAQFLSETFGARAREAAE